MNGDVAELTRERSPGAWCSSALLAEGFAALNESAPLDKLATIFDDAIQSGHVVSILGGPQLY